MSKKKKKLILVVLLFILLLAAAGYTVFIAPLLEKEVVEYTPAEVYRGAMVVGVTESGYLEYEVHDITYDLDLTVTDESDDEDDEDEEETVQKYLCIEEVYAAQGQMISAGDAMLKFTEDSVSQVRKMLENALVDAKVEYNDAESEYRLAVLEAENTLKMQDTAAKYADDIYNATSSSINDEIASLELQITQLNAKIPDLEEALTDAGEGYAEAKAAYEDAKTKYEATEINNASNFFAMQSEYSNAKSALERIENSMEQAQKALDNNAEQIEKLSSQLQNLKAKKSIEKMEAKQEYEETVISGENAKYSYEATMESLEEDLKEAEEEKKAMEEKLADFEALVGDDGILYAPNDGKVTQVGYSSGDTLERTGTLFSYIMEEGMTVSVDVTQEDIVSLNVGDSVNIEFAAYEDETYLGTIYSIDTTATSADTPTISYTVVINVEGSLDKIYGGMSANITFVTESREDTLYVSRKAVIEENGKTYVYVKGLLGDKEKQEVETGIRNESSVEILSGLDENDTIYIVSHGES